MKILKSFLLIALAIALGSIISCDENGDFVIFSIEDDKMLGEQVANEIANDTENFNLMSREEFPGAYEYIDAMLDDILASDEITYREEFDWNITLIDDETLNAFAAPGGQLYVYTGLIYFLEKEDDLAGVIGHEVAHADQRHSSKQLQRQYGISVLLSILTGGEQGALEEIVGQIAGTGAILAFSRNAEAEADDFSVRYLSSTQYACNGAAAFFGKLLENQEQRNPEFLSTHPSPDNRVEDINAIASEISCNTTVSDESVTRYRNFWTLLP